MLKYYYKLITNWNNMVLISNHLQVSKTRENVAPSLNTSLGSSVSRVSRVFRRFLPLFDQLLSHSVKQKALPLQSSKAKQVFKGSYDAFLIQQALKTENASHIERNQRCIPVLQKLVRSLNIEKGMTSFMKQKLERTGHFTVEDAYLAVRNHFIFRKETEFSGKQAAVIEPLFQEFVSAYMGLDLNLSQ
jgi:hypothetical protein